MEENQTALKRWIVNIWPTIHMKLTSFFYWVLTVIRKTVQTALDQIR